MTSNRNTSLVALPHQPAVSSPPRVFIIYARDDPGHVDAVLRFAKFLRGQGMDTHLDVWDHDGGDDWNLWALDHITRADFVLVVASPQCRTAADAHSDRTGGTGVESALAILHDRLVDDRVKWLAKVHPVVLPDGVADQIPLFLNARVLGYHQIEAFTEAGAGSVLRTIMR
jgi:hypothetical protein